MLGKYFGIGGIIVGISLVIFGIFDDFMYVVWGALIGFIGSFFVGFFSK